MKIKFVVNILKAGLVIILGLLVLIGVMRFISSLSSPKVFVAPKKQVDSREFKMVDWSLLRQMDYRSGVSSDELQQMDGRGISIPGFIVPLEDNQLEITEFLLVPSPQACIHVPPPPPNQMIYVKMRNPISFGWGMRAYWVSGVLNLTPVNSPYGSVSFEMIGESIKPFQFGKSNL